jgi:hypothetical protein
MIFVDIIETDRRYFCLLVSTKKNRPPQVETLGLQLTRYHLQVPAALRWKLRARVGFCLRPASKHAQYELVASRFL